MEISWFIHGFAHGEWVSSAQLLSSSSTHLVSHGDSLWENQQFQTVLVSLMPCLHMFTIPKSSPCLWYIWYTLWWTNIAMENHHAINGKIHYKWPFSIAMLVHQRVLMIFMGGINWHSPSILQSWSGSWCRHRHRHGHAHWAHRAAHCRGGGNIQHEFHRHPRFTIGLPIKHGDLMGYQWKYHGLSLANYIESQSPGLLP